MSTEPILNVVLFQPEIPGNTGAVGRTCVAVGAKLWLVRPLGFRLDHRQMRRAGLDYWQHIECEVVDDWNHLVSRLPNAEQKPWLLTKTATRSYTDVEFERSDVLIFGSETRGLPPSLLAGYPEGLLRIPIRPEARSLNLSVSAGIVVYEALRQIQSRRP